MIEKIKVLKSVEFLPQANALQVLWEVSIVEDGEVISSNNSRCTYSAEEKEKFLTEVEGAEKYVGLVEWVENVAEVTTEG